MIPVMKLRHKKRHTRPNLLEMKPLLKPGLRFEQGDEGARVHVPRNSWLERQAVRFLNQPEVIRVRLDRLGAAVIRRCDGEHTLSEIAQMIHAEFGEQAEPLIPRLAAFIKMVEANGWLDWELAADE
ncbi:MULTISPECIES: PqqD family protein [Paenibacillus]|uniref:PqqD family protein n=1 Tax=Paenibacillus TaxID=44249 RepID=UPI001E2ED003|nr:PqqD family protein [Paenibacillus sp. IHBB 10380]